MDEPSDASTGIGVGFFTHCVAGMHLGRMSPTPLFGEFDAVLSVGETEGKVEGGMRHKHLHLPYGPEMDRDKLNEAAAWVQAQVDEDRKVLIRSEGGRQRPALVIAVVVLRLGGYFFDAITCVRCGNQRVLTDFRYLNDLREIEREWNPRLPLIA